MTRRLSSLMAIVLCLSMLLGMMPAVMAEEAAAVDPFAYIMYANSDWSKQYWGSEAEGVTAVNATITGAGAYTVSLSFAEPSEGLAFAALGIKEGENAFPNYTIEIKEIRVNGEAIDFVKGYTSSDDGVETRMNVYNEWVNEVPADARSFDGDVEGVDSKMVDPALFASVNTVEIDFVLHQFGVDIAYIMFANSDWSKQYWGEAEVPEGITATNAVIDGFGDYSVALEFAEPSEGLAFTALGIVKGEKTYPGAFLKINEIRLNGEAIEFTKGYTSSDDGITTRMNVFNEWVSEVPEDARSFDGTVEEASPKMVDPALFTGVSKFEIDFSLVPVTDTAYIMFANADWSKQYWGEAEAPEGITAANATIEGAGTYTVGLTFAEPSEGLAFTALGIVKGETSFNGYFIDIKEIRVNGEAIELGKGYTSSDDGITTRENIYNEWVAEVPADARRADGDLEGASPIIVDKAAFEAVTSIEVTFDYIYGKPIVKDADAPLTEEEAAALMQDGFMAYIGVQGTDTYVFRNAWNDKYGLTDEENPDFFGRLTGWDADNKAVDYGGTFVDAEIKGNGEYSVSLTTGEMGFGSTEAYNLLFISTNIPGKLVRDGFITIDNVKTKIGDAATREYTNVDASGEYVMIKVIDTYNIGEAPFGYTVPGPDASITITFTVSGMPE